MKDIYVLKACRRRTHDLVTTIDERRLVEIPSGFRNNVAWNVGHMIATQQQLHYRLSGLEPPVPEPMIAAFRKGTSPADWISPPDWKEIVSLLIETADRLDSDYAAGRFQTFSEYTTSAGIALHDIDESIAFNNFHEGIHLGVAMSILKQVR